MYSEAVLLIAVENNMTELEPGRIEARLRHYLNGAHGIRFVHGKPDSNVEGVWTGPTAKEDYAKTMAQSLSDDQLRFVDDAYGISSNWKAQKSKLINQLGMYRKRRMESADGTSIKIAYTGKTKGCPDDASMCAQMTLSWHKRIRVDPLFSARYGAPVAVNQ